MRRKINVNDQRSTISDLAGVFAIEVGSDLKESIVEWVDSVGNVAVVGRV